MITDFSFDSYNKNHINIFASSKILLLDIFYFHMYNKLRRTFYTPKGNKENKGDHNGTRQEYLS